MDHLLLLNPMVWRPMGLQKKPVGVVDRYERLLLFVLLTFIDAADITGKEVGITDVGTITVLTSAKESVKVCLYGIDATDSAATRQ